MANTFSFMEAFFAAARMALRLITKRVLLVVGLAIIMTACDSNAPDAVSPPGDNGSTAEPPASAPAPHLVPKVASKPDSTSRFPKGSGVYYVMKGNQYEILASADGYAEEGEASWYGRRFHGKRTANGEVYNMNDFTAAHRTLPMNTWVKVTNLENDREVLLRINDRGPFDDYERLIDLSYAGALALDMVRHGKVLVRVETVKGDINRYRVRGKGDAPGRLNSRASGPAMRRKLRQNGGTT